MPSLNLSFTITAIIALCALLSPILTALINNHHQKTMKKLDYKEQRKKESIERRKEIFDSYLGSVGEYVHRSTAQNRSEYGRYSQLAIYYAPDHIIQEMIQLDDLISKNDFAKSRELARSISLKLHKWLKEQ